MCVFRRVWLCAHVRVRACACVLKHSHPAFCKDMIHGAKRIQKCLKCYIQPSSQRNYLKWFPVNELNASLMTVLCRTPWTGSSESQQIVPNKETQILIPFKNNKKKTAEIDITWIEEKITALNVLQSKNYSEHNITSQVQCHYWFL